MLFIIILFFNICPLLKSIDQKIQKVKNKAQLISLQQRLSLIVFLDWIYLSQALI